MASSKERPLIFCVGINLKMFATVLKERDPDCGLGQADRERSRVDCAAHHVLVLWGARVRPSSAAPPPVSRSEPPLAPLSFL